MYTFPLKILMYPIFIMMLLSIYNHFSLKSIHQSQISIKYLNHVHPLTVYVHTLGSYNIVTAI